MNPVEDHQAEGEAQPQDTASKRRYDRFDWNARIQVLWFDEHARNSCVTLRTQDLSAGGIAIISSSWINTKRRGAVLLTDGNHHRSVRWIEVLHGRYVSERKAHVIGCRWIAAPENAPPVRIIESATGQQLEFDTDLVAKTI